MESLESVETNVVDMIEMLEMQKTMSKQLDEIIFKINQFEQAANKFAETAENNPLLKMLFKKSS